MKMTKEQARELAKSFLDMSIELSEFRFRNWGALGAAKRRDISDIEWTLHNYSDDFTTIAVGLALDDLDKDLKAIKRSTNKAKKIVKTVDKVKDVLKVASAMVMLGGAIASQNPGAIVKAAADLYEVARDLEKKD